MTAVKYTPCQKPPRNGSRIGAFLFQNPLFYFIFLFIVSFFMLFLSPHTVILHDSTDAFAEGNRDLSDFNVNIPSVAERSQSSLEFAPLTESLKLNEPLPALCNVLKDNEKFDCFPQGDVSQAACYLRGCCWVPVNSTKQGISVPYCYYPSKFMTYKYVNVSQTDTSITAFLENVLNSSYPNNIQLLKIDINYLYENILQVKIYDAQKSRYESPFPKMSLENRCSEKNTSYMVNIDKDKLGFNIVRKSNNQSIFNTEDVGGFIFADQLLQVSARLPSRTLYGLGQQRNNFQLDMDWRRITMFNRDQEPSDNTNLYGSHPFYVAVEDGGLSSGVFLHNSNAMDIILQPLPGITYRTIGGVLDFFVFLGPSPADVLRQFTMLVGRPFLPPYWSLGFHLCRYGYNSLNNTMTVWNRTRAAGIPFDTQWNDIDYMETNNDFTYDKINYKGLPKFVDLLHKEGMHYVMITDPGVSAGEAAGTYPPYDDGIKDRIFIKDPLEEKPFITKVWNSKSTVMPDFFHPKAKSYWQRQISQFHDIIHFDGLWIDMNDPSTFWDGDKKGCAANPLDNPPYLPAVQGGHLYSKTLCMSARHYDTQHYNVHNIYGSQEAVITSQAMQEVRKKRPFVISRSSYPGHGHFAGIWTGDVSSSWDDMAHSVSDILSFSLFGIPMSGADICGFNDNTTAALCKHWSQLGAFYPFARNHNSDENIDQDPVALGPEVVKAARSALLTRYSLLPYLYTLFWHAHTSGDTVARPMFVQFPEDEKTYNLHSQFLWGPALLIVPFLSQDKKYPIAYLPAGRWYDFYSLKPIESKGGEFLLPLVPDNIPLLLNGGHIIVTQQPNTTTTASRNNPFGLIVSLCKDGNAIGSLYWDEGDTIDYQDGAYNYITLAVAERKLTSKVQQWKYAADLHLADVKVLGVEQPVTKVEIDGHAAQFDYMADVKVLKVTNLTAELSKPFTLTWS